MSTPNPLCRLLVPLCLLAASSCFVRSIEAQEAKAQEAKHQPIVTVPLPAALPRAVLEGERPGTELWLVTLDASEAGAGEIDRTALAAALRGPAHDERTIAAVAACIDALQQRCATQRAPFVERLGALGGRVLRHFWLVDTVLVEIPAQRVDALHALPGVARVDPETLVAVAAAPIDEAASIANHAVRQVHELGIRGQGLTLAILDTGLDSNVASLGRPHAVYFANGEPQKPTGPGIGGSRLLANLMVGSQGADDVSGHGTAVSAVAIGARWNQKRGVGAGHAPEATLVGYALADTKAGGTRVSTMVTAVEWLLRDTKTYGFRCANFSYLGHPDPVHPAQQALDRAQRLGDLLVTTPGGNQGGSTAFSMSNANGLAVGAVQSNTRRVAAFSSRGPLEGDPQRWFPDLVANGAGLLMPKSDDESAIYSTVGTSTAAPQVAGSALLFRGLLPQLSALEVKAAILASTDDVSMHNAQPPLATRNAYGVGYLRSDRLIELARSRRGDWWQGELSPSRTELRFGIDVQTGQTYSAVVAWHRMDETLPVWSDLRLRLVRGTQVLASSDDPRNLYEKFVFEAARTERLELVVDAPLLRDPKLPFGLVLCELDAPTQLGGFTSFGLSCQSSAAGDGVDIVLPADMEEQFGSVWSPVPLGGEDHRFLQLLDMSAHQQPLTIEGLALRHDEQEVYRHLEYGIDLEIRLGVTLRTPAQMSPNFDENYSGAPTVVLPKQRITLPVLKEANSNPRHFAIRLKFDRPFVWSPAPGRHLLVELVRHGSSDGNGSVFYLLDATVDPQQRTSSVLAPGPSASSGLLSIGGGLVLGLMTSAPNDRAWPSLAWESVPVIGRSFRLEVRGAQASSPGVFTFGTSKEHWQHLPLPFDLGPGGAPRCFVHASVELLSAVLFDAHGVGAVDFFVPPQRSWAGRRVFAQAILLDGPANDLGLVTTNGLEARIAGDG